MTYDTFMAGYNAGKEDVLIQCVHCNYTEQDAIHDPSAYGDHSLPDRHIYESVRSVLEKRTSTEDHDA